MTIAWFYCISSRIWVDMHYDIADINKLVAIIETVIKTKDYEKKNTFINSNLFDFF